jgi:hypothetical protein
VVPPVVPDLHEPHAPLDQPAGEEELLALGRVAVGRPHRLGLLVQVEGVRRRGLHLEGDLVGLEPGLEHLVVLEVARPHLVELLHEVHLAALLGRPDVGVADVLDHLLHRRHLRVDARALEHARQEGRAVVGRAPRGQPAVAQRDEAGEVLVLGAEAVHDPRAHARLRDPQRARVHEHGRHLVRRDVRVHRADDRHVVDVLADPRGRARSPRCPSRPMGVNLNGEPIATPLSPIVRPSMRTSSGFGSQVSMCEGAPWAKMWITALAVAGSGGPRGARGLAPAEKPSASGPRPGPRGPAASPGPGRPGPCPPGSGISCA